MDEFQPARVEVTGWIGAHHRLWDERFGELDRVLEAMKQKEQSDGRRRR